MRVVLAACSVAAALVFMAASAAMNWVFLKALGKTELEGHIFGAFSVALDVTKSLLPIFIGWALAAGGKRVYALIASLVFVLLFGFSLVSAIGFAALNRGAVVGGKEVVAARYAVAQGDAEKVERDLAALRTSRPQAVIVEALRGLEQDRRWTTSKSCTEATASESRTFCEGYFAAKAELATATERGRMEARLRELRGEISALQDAGAGQDNDPQATLLARLTGVGVSTAQMGLVMFVAVLVEVLAAFGLYLAVGWIPERKQAARVVVAAPVVNAVEPEPVATLPSPSVPDVPELAAADYWRAPPKRLRLIEQSS